MSIEKDVCTVAHAISPTNSLESGLHSKPTKIPETQHDQVAVKQVSQKGLHFWMVFLAICAALFLSALELTAVGTALPTIIHDLKGEDFVWVSSAYSLASTALLPASGGFAQVFGRRAAMLGSLVFFAVGSAVCGSAKNLDWLIIGRTIQGAGGGGILSLSSIIVSDLVTLQERGTYNGFIGMTWAVAGCIGPIVGGALANEGQWRWLFYLNLPICAIAACLVITFCKMRKPCGTLQEKLARIDWIGNILIIGSSGACILALAWAAVRFSWTSAQVLVPLIVGVAGIFVFFLYEATLATEPIVPFTLLTNQTTVSGYIQTFLSPIIVFCIIYYLPAYFQACKDASPIRGGVLTLGLCFSLGPGLVLTGASVSITKVYRPQLWVGWIIFTISMVIMSTINADTATAKVVGLPVLVGFSAGMIYSTTYFPVLAPTPVTQNAYALAFFSFCRSLAAAWGISIGTAILQSQLKNRLPAELLQQLPGGVSFAYSIPIIRTLPEPSRTIVREAFADSIVVIWQAMIGVAGFGFLVSLVMKDLPLHTEMDQSWGMEDDHDSELRTAPEPTPVTNV